MRNLSDLKDFEALKIFLASSEDILSWSFGEVIKPETINYRTFKPERDGLFDERIFGPVKDYECYCGKYKRIRFKGVVCDKCGVEVTSKRVRRERMGHIKLASPVAHVWFFRGIPSKTALILDVSPRSLESVVYFSSFIVIKVDETKKKQVVAQVENDFLSAKQKLENELEKSIQDLQKQVKKLSKSEEFADKESQLKMKQKIQALREANVEKIEELEGDYRLVQKKVESVGVYTILSDSEYLNLEGYLSKFCEVEIGAEAIREILSKIDLNKLSEELSEELENSKNQKAVKLAKRLKVVEGFRKAEIEPERMILDVVPVIPPDLRPMVQLEGGRFATADLNDLYRRVINRNNRLKRLLDLGAPEVIIRNEKRMLQEAVDALFDQSKQRRTLRKSRRKNPRSLADLLKGKQGRFRQNLLGKRVDFSGRSVIVNGPELKLNECGIPKEMALELFKPFVLKEILARGYAPNVKSAKFVLDSRGPEIWDILEDLVKEHPVLLNRAPTLWRLGIQAFYPKLIEGNAVRLHLCVCPGYNADFDGDQMAVHLPLSKQAIKEAKELMISTNNLLKPADGSPISIPTKVMIVGIYYLTSIDKSVPVFDTVFSSIEEAFYVYEATGKIKVRQRIKVMLGREIIETTPGRLIFNRAIPKDYSFINKPMTKSEVNSLLADVFNSGETEVIVKLIDSLKGLGFKYGTLFGHSIALSDLEVPESRERLIREGRESVREIRRNLARGLITSSEAQRLTELVWNKLTADVDERVWLSLDEKSPLKVSLESGGSQASRGQITQVAGVRGLVTDPMGRVVQLPILGNYKGGLSALEYFASSRGARKGLADRALKTADSGYLTRRLVDVAQDVIVREEDCGTEAGREIAVGERTVLNTFAERVAGRFLAEGARDKKGKVVVNKGTLLTKEDVEKIERAGVEKIVLRSPVNCETRRGVCSKCYGVDLMTRGVVKVGSAVGIAAAQSIGEPGTQLTMRTFQTGGIAGKDITQGLPRVEEVVEARAPKDLSIMSEVTGTVKILQSGEEGKVLVVPSDEYEDEGAVEYLVDPMAEIVVEDGQVVAKGEKLTSGHLDLTELLRVVGLEGTKKYILDEIQKVYASQGVSINDKHIEVIIRQMFGYVRIDEPGDTEFLGGELITKDTFMEENEKIVAEGGTPATADVTLLGITKAALNTDSFLSSASFIQTSSVLTDAAASGRVDPLLGLKENVILGRLIPTGERASLDE